MPQLECQPPTPSSPEQSSPVGLRRPLGPPRTPVPTVLRSQAQGWAENPQAHTTRQTCPSSVLLSHAGQQEGWGQASWG